LEASFCGADQGKFADYHFNIDLLQEVGHRFCDTILDFCDPDQAKVRNVLEELEIMLPKNSDSESSEASSDGDSASDDEKKDTKKSNHRRRDASSGGDSECDDQQKRKN